MKRPISSALVHFLIVSVIGMTTALRSFGADPSTPDVIFQLNGQLSEGDWGRPEIDKFFCQPPCPKPPSPKTPGPKLQWNEVHLAQYPAAKAGFSYDHCFGSANNGFVDFSLDVYVGFPVTGGSFAFPGLWATHSVSVYVRGPAGTPYSLEYAAAGIYTEQNSHETTSGFWESRDFGRTQWWVVRVGSSDILPKTQSVGYSRMGLTDGEPVVYNGADYTLATVLGEYGHGDHNGEGGGNGPSLKISSVKGKVQANVSRLAPVIQVEPKTIEFETTNYPIPNHDVKHFTIKNTGPIGSVLTGDVGSPVPNTPFVTGTVPPFSLQSGEEITVSVAIDPSKVKLGINKSDVEITSNDTDKDKSPQTVHITYLADAKPIYAGVEVVDATVPDDGLIHNSIFYESTTGDVLDLKAAGIKFREVLMWKKLSGELLPAGKKLPDPFNDNVPSKNPVHGKFLSPSYSSLKKKLYIEDHHYIGGIDLLSKNLSEGYIVVQRWEYWLPWVKNDNDNWPSIAPTNIFKRKVEADGTDADENPLWKYHIHAVFEPNTIVDRFKPVP